jgi:hypothetical protein
MCILFYPKFLAGEGTCKGDARCGMHAVPRVTSVNPGACKYNRRNEPREGIFSIRTRLPEREPGGGPLQEYFVPSRNGDRETIRDC